ncbi:potassium channel family protein [Rhizorhapis sp. SPR117]|uniref:potassium channel family protein n=1 Tax=Rhizorhapis sp. SPR117 TaxID=2912611 RepID=UPI001F25425B|nr:potassium channel family protein [Rhizorhapis sp. SPR117]
MRIDKSPRGPVEALLRRRSSLSTAADIGWRVALVFGLMALVLLVHWLDRDSLRDNLDGDVNFVDILYFTTVTITTVGYGDIVPVTPQARLFEALIVTPVRLFVWLIFLGTAYHFVIRNTFNRWRMARIQKNLDNHIIAAGFGTSGSEAIHELIARGTPADRIVVVDPDERALQDAEALGCNILCGDATRDKTLEAVRVSRASALIISAGRDDTSILVTLTARHLAPNVAISVAVRNEDNEIPARQAGATTVINPVSFAGLLLAGSCHGLHISDYLADLASVHGRVKLNERPATSAECGNPLSAITTGLGVRIYRGGKAIGFWEEGARSLQMGDTIVEIVEGGE